MELEPEKQVTSRVATSCLFGKIILDYPLRERQVKCFARVAWKCNQDFTVSDVGLNTFLFCFEDKQDWIKVLLNAPWNIRGGLLVLSPWTCGQIPDELEFSFSPFWVQVHGLPVDYFTKGVLGRFICLDRNVFDVEKVSWRKFLRIRVVLDVRRPLLSGHWIRRAGLSDAWIEFRYENLGRFCYKCGRIGNHYRTCKFPEVPGYLSVPPCFHTSVASSFFDCRGTEEVDTEHNPCTTTTSMLIQKQSSSSGQKIYDEQQMESSDQTCHDTEKFSTRRHQQRLIMHSIDSMGMIVNCGVIHYRVAAAAATKAHESKWRLVMVMAAYFLYLVLKLIRVTRESHGYSKHARFRVRVRVRNPPKTTMI